jgi:hypothetical protein
MRTILLPAEDGENPAPGGKPDIGTTPLNLRRMA